MALRDIQFFSEDIDFKVSAKQKIREWIFSAIQQEGFKRVGDLSFVMCSDDYLLEINKKYLNHDTLDIVTFDSSEIQEMIAGDIFISVDRIRENAEKFSVTENEELHRVIIHGILHLCGYHDKKQQEKALMRKKEDYYLSQRNF